MYSNCSEASCALGLSRLDPVEGQLAKTSPIPPIFELIFVGQGTENEDREHPECCSAHAWRVIRILVEMALWPAVMP